MDSGHTSDRSIIAIQSPFWTADEAATYCRVSINTMQHLLRTGEIPARRVGRQWRILKRDLDEYLGLKQPGIPDRKGR
jgi:excisionase family DNA binding protein